MRLMLVGAGGHAKAICEAIKAGNDTILAYVDARPAPWLDVPRIEREDVALAEKDPDGIVVGVGGVTAEQLARRLALLDRYCAAGFAAPVVIHPRAVVSDSVALGAGAIVLAGAVLQPDTAVQRGALVNTGAVVEHDSDVGAGAHVAPGAIVLGGWRVGACAMVGAGAVVLPGAVVPERHLVKALSVFPAGKK